MRTPSRVSSAKGANDAPIAAVFILLLPSLPPGSTVGHPVATHHALKRLRAESDPASTQSTHLVPVPVPVKDPACELQLTNATQQIARLRSLALDAARCCERKADCVEIEAAPQSCDVTKARRTYAPPSPGELPDRVEHLAPTQPAPLRSSRIVSGLGSLIDVLM